MAQEQPHIESYEDHAINHHEKSPFCCFGDLATDVCNDYILHSAIGGPQTGQPKEKGFIILNPTLSLQSKKVLSS